MLARQERMFSANKPAARVQHNPLMSKVAGAPIRLATAPAIKLPMGAMPSR